MRSGVKNKQITMNLSMALWDALEELGTELKIKDLRGVHTPLAREIVSAIVLKWRKSPYVCHGADHFVLVTSEGHIFYRLVQNIKLNFKRKKLPCILDMKPEKTRDFLLRRDEGVDEAAWFKSRWLLNYFCVWQGVEEKKGDIINSWVDNEGTTAKVADLEINQGPNRNITRELIVGLEDYVQWKDLSGVVTPEVESTFDRVDFPIDIPTRNFKITVIVDAELYRRSSFGSLDEIPHLAMEFRNREGAKFEGPTVSFDSENPIADEFASYYEVGKRYPRAEPIIDKLKKFQERVQAVASGMAANGPVLSEDGRRRFKERFKRPKNFLFYELDWPSPQWGLEICIGWEKPVPLQAKVRKDNLAR